MTLLRHFALLSMGVVANLKGYGLLEFQGILLGA